MVNLAMIEEYQEYLVALTGVDSAASAIRAAAGCDNGEHTRSTLAEARGNLFKYLAQLETTIEEINNASSTCRVVVDGEFQFHINALYELAKRVKAFVVQGDEGTDADLDELRAYIDSKALTDMGVRFSGAMKTRP